jgi:hypothetical protein
MALISRVYYSEKPQDWHDFLSRLKDYRSKSTLILSLPHLGYISLNFRTAST